MERSAGVMILAAAFLLLNLSLEASAQGLKVGFYNLKCRRSNVESIVTSQVIALNRADKTICASIIRLHFHDCFVQGCDGSVLLDFADPSQSEKNSPPNANSLRGFSAIDTIKAALESRCPGLVSCADILALASRDCIFLLRGEAYRVPTGRRDGTTSGGFSGPLTNLPAPFHPIDTLISIFSGKGLSITDLVELSGLHTVGMARCITIFTRIWNTDGTPLQDPLYTFAFAQFLRAQCPFDGDRQVRVNMDATAQIVDTSYYRDILRNTAFFQSDSNLLNNTQSAARVKFLAGSRRFFGVGASMINMGNISPLTGTAGQIRQLCNAVNPTASSTPAPVAISPSP